MKRLFLAALVALLPLMAVAAPAASEGVPTALDPVANKRAVAISEQLRCLVCQNQSIAESNAELAVDLKNQVNEQIKAGKSDQQIVDFMVERYGDFVLYKPPFKAQTVILWVGPAVLLIVGLGVFFMNLRSRRHRVDERPLTEAERREAERLLAGTSSKESSK
ncbi:MAG: cytochrome c-type biogenesis protein [Burkholderiaceae bacterium]